jgi:DNA (cytosine-5)-methyltransferase 1
VGLHDFEIFRSPVNASKWAYELSSLHLIARGKDLCFNGHVYLEGVNYYLEDVEIASHSVEGYGDLDDSGVVIYVQPKCALQDAEFDVWFRLHEPATRYWRFHSPFQWIANFARHALDYMEVQPSESVRLEDFHVKFFSCLKAKFGQDQALKNWHTMFGGKSDFRVTFNAYVDYVWQQAHGLANANLLLAHPIWSQCLQGSEYIKRQAITVTDTIATPHVYQCFAHMYFAEKLKSIQPCESVRREQARRKRKLGFASDRTQSVSDKPPLGDAATQKLAVRVGDVIAFKPDEKDQKYWKRSGTEWLAYVQRVEPLNDETERLFVLWIYRPDDTNMFLARYPINNEVFLSDNCNCDEGILLSSDVSRKLTIHWLPKTLNTTSDVLIRQTYITQESSFIAFQKDHLTCLCRADKKTPTICYRAGDTVYITKTFEGEMMLEPVLVHHVDEKLQLVTVRLFLRLGRDCTHIIGKPQRAHIAPNELVLTDKTTKFRLSKIVRACDIRFVARDKILSGQVPFPYNRDGAGDFWFLSMGLQETDGVRRLIYLSRLPVLFNKGDSGVESKLQKLDGLSIFSGGGNLDRGLEEGGAVEFKTVVDLSPEAIHTQRANAQNSDNVEYFCGSVDDHLAAILSGKIPLPPCQLVSAGSPWLVHPLRLRLIADQQSSPGFSVMQQDFLSSASLSNASHISTFCSYVDVARPKYGILENVINMASTRKGYEEQNVMSQLVACLVSLGYQVSQFIMDSWTCASGQQKSRVLLVIAAPELAPIIQPKHTNSMPYEDTVGRSLGHLPNEQKFGEREHYPTPFSILTAGMITSDLPEIGNGNVQACIPFPDHRLSSSHNRDDRALIERIPRYPPGSGYALAHRQGLIPPTLQKVNKKEIGKCFQRVKEHGLIPTITTGISPQNGRGGATLHWSEPRPMTIQEARRAQGYLDSEVIIGSLRQQWAIVGNGVDRKVSLALGFGLYQAVVASQRRAIATATEDLNQLSNRHRELPTKSSSNASETLASTTKKNEATSSCKPKVDESSLSSNRVLINSASYKSEESSAFPPGVEPKSPLSDSEDELARSTPAKDLRAPLTSPTKRNHDGHPLEIGRSTASSSNPGKRVKTDSAASASSSHASRIDGRSPWVALDRSSDGSLEAQGKRQTRVSGLQVRYVPRSWDERPERKHRRMTEGESLEPSRGSEEFPYDIDTP